jgi:hypothetical protein
MVAPCHQDNWEILQAYDMDLAKALQAQPYLTLMIRSEFQPTYVLEPLLQHAPPTVALNETMADRWHPLSTP